MGARSYVVAIHQPEVLPWLGFMDKLRQCDVFVLLDHVQFQKHDFQNRNRIRTSTPQGWSWLTIPVRSKGRFGQPICQVDINGTSDWRRKHLAAIELNYHHAQAFTRFWPSLKARYETPWERLVDFSTTMIEWLVEGFGLRRTMIRSSELMGIEGSRSELLLSICRRMEATEYLSGISGHDYLDTEVFRQAGIAVRFQEFHHPVYRQCYEPFVPALSSLDLLLNYGDEALTVLESQDVPRLSTLFR